MLSLQICLALLQTLWKLHGYYVIHMIDDNKTTLLFRTWNAGRYLCWTCKLKPVMYSQSDIITAIELFGSQSSSVK